MYPRALSAGDVSALYGLGRGGADVTTGKLTTSWTLDQRGLPTSMTDPDGNVTNYSYDEAGQLAQTTQPAVSDRGRDGGVPVTARPESQTGYDTFGDTTENEDPDGNVTTYGIRRRRATGVADAPALHAAGIVLARSPPPRPRLTTTRASCQSQTDALGNKTSYSYDQLGDLTSETDPDGGVTSYTYDADSEELSEVSPTGAQTQKTYDFVGRDATSTQLERYSGGSGTAAYTTNFTYSPGGWLATSQTPDGALTSRLYDAAGELTSVTDPAGNVTAYAYDDFGRQTGTTNPTARRRPPPTTPAATSRPRRTSTPPARRCRPRHRRTTATATSCRQPTPWGTRPRSRYDPSGSVTQEVQPVSASSGVTTSFGYDAAGNKTRYTDGNGDNWYYTYNAWGLPETGSSRRPRRTARRRLHLHHGLRRRRPRRVGDQPGGVTIADSYNNSGELTGESGTGADAATATRTLGYDPAGQLTSATTSNTATGTARRTPPASRSPITTGARC